MTTSVVTDDVAYGSATGLAEAIRTGKIASREVLDVLLDRVERLDGPINSVVTVDAERARREAAAADEAVAAGGPLGPLHGVPITIKDSWQTAGMRTTSGAPELADLVPEVDAWPVARLREAGAIVYGKTNLPIWAGDFQTYNDVFGTTNNPFDTSRTPGGSSGGSAAALACGFTPLELGSDIGGSIRLPAHMSGVTGHKPSYGIVPTHGQIPGLPGTLSLADLAVGGPMARTVGDLELALDLLVGPNRWDAPAWRVELPPSRVTGLEGCRVAAWLDDEHCPVDPEVKVLLDGAAAALAGAGAVVDTGARPDFTLAKAADTFLTLLHAALAGSFSRDQIERLAADPDDSPLGLTRRRTALRHRDWLTANERRMQMRLRFEEFFGAWDVLLLPVMPRTALEHDHSQPMASRLVAFGGQDRPYWDTVTWMAPAGACFLPATVVPVGTTGDGLPVGIQIVGPYLHDRTTLRVADRLAGLLGGCPRPPGF
jgi:amidase